ncbi:MAG: Adenine deaminase AdeC [Candidatus Methanohalarchaeum thermophilum]|uniref:Adenine deaminase n=1 Tax=Methanohalarchaeum thermophilum TaxID=1903181 RepID=A0A1Q6DTQ0_METT1|nr:MAG: Adenine deaminase AdeC [Candidatus Methanohalarchaeum thermophilum]
MKNPKETELSQYPSKKVFLTSLGKIKADLVIKDCNLINVYSGEILEDIDVAVKNGKIAYVGEADHTVGDFTTVLDLDGDYLAPGLLDGHVHIEDSMCTLTSFTKSALPLGTTGVFMDPHEIANVLGLEGIKLMIEESKNVPLRTYITIPSCVPSTSSEFETNGGKIGPNNVKKALEWDETIGLGEVMNYEEVISGEDKYHQMIKETVKAKKTVEGHAPGLSLKKLNSYIAAGPSSCHESTTKEEGLQKVRLGMHLMIREGFASLKNLKDIIKIITEDEIDTKQISLVTDDRHPRDLVEEGHMNHVVKRAIEEGTDPVKAIQMSTINTATHFRLNYILGGISPGKYADMVVISNLDKLKIKKVMFNGKIVAENGKLSTSIKPFDYPKKSKNTVHIPDKLNKRDFDIYCKNDSEVVVRVIKVNEDKPITNSIDEKLPTKNNLIQIPNSKELSKVAVIERHNNSGGMGLGFVKGFGIKDGATASTIAHDSHNLIVVGSNEKDMAAAANILREINGGIVVVKKGKTLAKLKLPIAGLMSQKTVKEIYKEMKEIKKAWSKIGCKLQSPLPTLTLLALPVLPELRITDKGLINSSKLKKTQLIKKKS